jgi:8-oxo-dGTP pyrophosphatase MutT (NUDIX family)
MLTLMEIRAQLAEYAHEPADFEATPMQAAVAMILAEGEHELDVCFIRRAERPGDPWSGQVAFPGGRAGPTDKDANAVAERETFEEIGMQITAANLIAPLPVRPIQRQHLELLSPFVYFVDPVTKRRAYVREQHEVSSVFWVPLSHLFDRGAATELEYPLGGNPQSFPGIRYGEHVIWGLTLRILESFADIVQRDLAARNQGNL